MTTECLDAPSFLRIADYQNRTRNLKVNAFFWQISEPGKTGVPLGKTRECFDNLGDSMHNL